MTYTYAPLSCQDFNPLSENGHLAVIDIFSVSEDFIESKNAGRLKIGDRPIVSKATLVMTNAVLIRLRADMAVSFPTFALDPLYSWTR